MKTIYKANRRKWFCCVFCFFVLTPLKTEAIDLPVQITQQSEPDWCWAAASVSVLNRYLKYPGVDIELNPNGNKGQCLLANKSRLVNIIDCCSYPTLCTYVVPSLQEIATILTNAPYQANVTAYSRTLTNAELASRINTNKRPVLAGLRNINDPTGVKHMVAIIGLDSTGTNALIMDPGRLIVDFYETFPLDNLRTGNLKNWQWFETITIDSNPPDDVKFRYSYIDKDSVFRAPGDFYVGPDYNVSLYVSLNNGHTTESKRECKIVVPNGKKVLLQKGFMAVEDIRLRIYRE